MSTEDVTVRVMEPNEFDAMRDVSVAAFDDESIGGLIEMLRSSWAWDGQLSFVAERNHEIVGQVLYTSAIVDAPDRLIDVLVLSPVGVRPDLHGQGIGSKLITESLQAVAVRPEPLVFLEGNPVYYRRFGFVAAGDHGFIRPSVRIPAPAFQVVPNGGSEGTSGRTLNDASLSGQLVYCDAFWRTDSVGLR